MTFRLPQAPEVPNIPALNGEIAAMQSWAKRLAAYVMEELRKRPPRGTAVGSVYLTSPNGSVYSVHVADDGTLISDLVRGPGDTP